MKKVRYQGIDFSKLKKTSFQGSNSNVYEYRNVRIYL